MLNPNRTRFYFKKMNLILVIDSSLQIFRILITTKAFLIIF